MGQVNPFDALLQLAALVVAAVLGTLTAGYIAYRLIRKVSK